MSEEISDLIILTETRKWLEKAVIGLNLCPFAKAAYLQNQIRMKISTATSPESLLEDLMVEMQFLADTEPAKIDTSLLIHPSVLTNFFDFNDFLGVAEQALLELKLEGILQVASFHPDYQFADTAPDDITNFTNRSPYPILHLLRETSVGNAVDSHPDPESIPEKNMEILRKLGISGWKKLFQKQIH